MNPISLPKIFEPIFSSDHRYICLDGGRGSGKSWTVAALLLLRGLKKKCRILCTREVQNTIKDSVHKLLSDKIQEYGMESYYQIKADSIVGINGTEFLFKGLYRNPQDIKSMEGIDYAWIEEAQSVSRPSLKTLVPTVRKDGSQIIFTYNPTNDDDPVHADYKLSGRPDCLSITANFDDNQFFPDVLRREMEYDRAHDVDKYNHVWCGQTVKHSFAQVFYGKWFIEDFDAPNDAFFYLGADWGFSQDPTCLVRCHVINNALYIEHEYYSVGVDIDAIPAAFRSIPESDKYPITADSARPETISYVKKNGFPLIRPSVKGKGSVEDGVALLRGFDKIVIHPRCKNTQNEFRLYCYKVDKLTGTVSKKLEDKHNHIIDSLRYALESMRANVPLRPPVFSASALGL